MHFIDPRTVILLTGVMSGLMSVVLYSLRRAYPASIRGLGEWSAGLMMVFIAGGLAAGRGKLPDMLSITLANYLVGSGLYALYLGSQRFFGVVPRVTPWLAFITATWALQVWFTYWQPNYQVRLLVSTVVSACVFAMHTRLFFTQGNINFARGLTLGILLLMTLMQLLRFAAAFVWPVGVDVLDASLHHVVYITTFAFSVLVLAIAFVLLATDQLRTELEHLATHDSLTNALTRRQMNDICQGELVRCRRSGRSMALLMMDLDHFKAINDTHGHLVGDQVLITFVNKVNALLRRPDRLGRFGGEEFVVLLPETSLEEAVSVAQRIREVCSQPEPGPGPAPSCTVSIGVTHYLQGNDTVDSILARADTALYRAKNKGRNCVETA